MTTKHKILKDFQYLTSEKKIIILKANSFLEEYRYKSKTEIVDLDKDIIDNNPEFFQHIDWKTDLHNYIKVSKLPQPAVLAKKLIPYIEENYIPLLNETNDIGKSDLTIFKERIKELEDEIRNKDIDNIRNKKELDGDLVSEIKNLQEQLLNKEKSLLDFSKNVSKYELEYVEKLRDLEKKELEVNISFNKKEADMIKSYENKIAELRNEYEEKIKFIEGKSNDLEKTLKLKEDKLVKSVEDLREKELDLTKTVEEMENKLNSLKSNVKSNQIIVDIMDLERLVINARQPFPDIISKYGFSLNINTGVYQR